MKTAAGLLIYRQNGDKIEVLLGHPGGPFYAKKDLGVWTIPKGEIDKDEELLTAAKREFKEELGFEAFVPNEMIELTPVKEPGKINHIWAFKGDVDLSAFKPGTFEMVWPPKSRKKMIIAEIDKIEWFELGEAKNKLRARQGPFIEELAKKLKIKLIDEPPIKELPNQGTFF